MFYPRCQTAIVGILYGVLLCLLPLQSGIAQSFEPAVAAAPVLRLDRQPQPSSDPEPGRPPLVGGELLSDPVYAASRVGTAEAVAAAEPQAGPRIDVWYGSRQHFGHNGLPIRWINVLGNVSPAGDIAALSYSLNDSAPRALDVGPNGARLVAAGDFNVELAPADLRRGENRLQIYARNGSGQESSTMVTVEYTPDQNRSLPYRLDWSTADRIDDLAQVIDGEWFLTGATVRTIQLGYDRLIAVGDITWRDFEVTVPVTIHALNADPAAFEPPNNGPGLGLLIRWQGHYRRSGDQQLTNGWAELGTLDWFRWRKDGGKVAVGLQRLGAEIDSLNSFKPNFGRTYMLKARVQDLSRCNGEAYYRFKVWEVTADEPSNWNIEGCEKTLNGVPSPPTGSFVLVAHHVDASFGTVTVTPLEQEQVALTVAAEVYGRVSVTPAQAVYAFGDQVTVTALPDAGYAFEHWTGSFTSAANPLTFNITKDTTLTASFVANAYPLTREPVGQGTIQATPEQAVYAEGSEVYLTAVPAPGWSFTRWEGSLSGAENPLKVTVAAPVIARAVFEVIFYEVAVGVTGEGEVLRSAPAPYQHGSAVQFIATPAPGWLFEIWSGALPEGVDGTSAQLDLIVERDLAIQAEFVPQSHQLTVSATGSGSGQVVLVPEQSRYPHGSRVRLRALAAGAGAIFQEWRGDLPAGALATATELEVVVRRDLVLEAVFAHTYTLATAIEGAGVVEIAPQQEYYLEEEPVVVVAGPSSGWEFVHWQGNLPDYLDATLPTFALKMKGNLQITAVFRQKSEPAVTLRHYLPIVTRAEPRGE